MLRPISESLANSLYDILVEVCQADSSQMGRDMFMNWATTDDGYRSVEYRFCGMFGMAGKIWLEHDRVRVSGPNHQELAESHNESELVAAEKLVNERIQTLVKE